MTRRLLLMRHAKSDWSRPLSDHDRVLNARGLRDAAKMGRVLSARGWTPNMALVSTAARTEETFALLEDALGRDVPKLSCPDLYLPPADAIRQRVADADLGVGCLLLLSHNPTCEDVASSWAGEPIAMRTACVAVFQTDATWREAMEAPRQHLRFITRLSPRDP